MIDYKQLFSGFPVIEDQFDLIAVDCIKVSQVDESFFVPIIRYMIRNHEEKKVEAGLTIRTGAVCHELSDVANFIGKLTSTGFFLADVCAYGTIYDEDMNDLEDVNWNDIIKLMTDDLDLYNHEEQKPTYLH